MSPAPSFCGRRTAPIATVSWLLFLTHPVAAAIQEGIPQTILADREYEVNENVNEWEQFPPTVQIRGQMDIWIGQTDEGLVVVGQGPALDTSRGGETSIWVADGEHVILPSVGWRHRFGDFYLPSEDYCATQRREIYPEGAFLEGFSGEWCRAWFREQLEYRKAVRKLFERRWRVSGWGDVEETLAAQTFAGLSSRERRALKDLDPNDADQAEPSARFWGQFASGTEIGGFEFKIPWSALPPSHTLHFETLRFAISTGAGLGSFLEAGEGHYWRGEVSLSEPRTYFITPCEYPLEGVQLAHGDRLNWDQWTYYDDRSNGQQGRPIHIAPSKLLRWIAVTSYVRHADSLDARKVVVMGNSDTSLGGQPRLSPRASLREHFVLPAPGDAIVCGPQLAAVSPNGERLIADADSEALRKGLAYTGYGDHMGDPRPRKAEVVITDGEIDKGADVRAFKDYLLIRTQKGPFVYPRCGGYLGCAPRVRYEVFKVSFDPLAISVAFHFEGRSSMYNYFDIRMDEPDWSRIHILNSRPGDGIPRDCQELLWRRTTYCRNDASGKFRECEMVEEVPMPESVQIDWGMTWDCSNPPVFIGEPE